MTKPQPTWTINPLHFGDLEPHRFEDLVRQLAYGFKRWRVLEPLGRTGADDGIDVRGIETVPLPAESPDLGGEVALDTTDRTWWFQCKREKSFGPAKARAVVADALNPDVDPPYGFVLAVPTDLSKNTRETLAAELHQAGVREVVAWGRTDLEDLLYLPENDHLLFAYFGISIQVRRQNDITKLRSQLARKRQLFNAVGDLDHRGETPVLLRDPSVTGYPYRDEVEHWDPANPPWMWTEFVQHSNPETLALVYRRHYAWITVDHKRYDAIETWSTMKSDRNDTDLTDEQKAERDRVHRYFFHEVPSENRGWLLHVGWIGLDDILLVDDLGDVFNRPPHVLAHRDREHGYFFRTRTFVQTNDHRSRKTFPANELRRTKLFPNPIPDVAGDRW